MTNENFETVKGFKDFTGEDAVKRASIKKILVEIFEKYGFEPAEAPTIEFEEFVRGNNTDDEAVSDIFKLEDKGKRKLALRYELTFQLKRLMKNKKLPYRRYQIGEVFRDEPVSSNRLRQFTSCDADIVSSNIKDEAEILSMVNEFLDKLKIKFRIYVNNKKLMNEILDEFEIKEKEKVIREIDKLDKLSVQEVQQNLKKFGAEKVIDIFKKEEKYFEKYKSYEEIKELKKYCKIFGVNITFLPSLARGLSYYTGTVFEVKSDIKETILGGGSYIFNGVQSVGFGVSIERLEIVSKIKSDKEKILVISIEQDKKAISISQKLREQGNKVEIFYNKVSKALDYANSKGIDKVIFIGRDEVKKGKFKVKDMKSGRESLKKEKELF